MPRRCRLFMAAVLLIVSALSSACANKTSNLLQDGYYAAEAAEFDEHGWKEFISICVNNNRIVTVEYNAKNASGFIKSWDMDYMRVMNAVSKNYPNRYTRQYAAALLNSQNPDKIDVMTGATHSYQSFVELANATIAQAKRGDKRVVFVKLSSHD